MGGRKLVQTDWGSSDHRSRWRAAGHVTRKAAGTSGLNRVDGSGSWVCSARLEVKDDDVINDITLVSAATLKHYVSLMTWQVTPALIGE